MWNPAVFLMVLSVTFGAVGQLSLKYGMLKHPNFQVNKLLSLAASLPVVAGFGCYGLSTLLYMQALGELKLSQAYPMVSLGYVLVVLLSMILFKETISRERWLAVFVICAGVILVGLAAG